jgi:hypothetical protein
MEAPPVSLSGWLTFGNGKFELLNFSPEIGLTMQIAKLFHTILEKIV